MTASINARTSARLAIAIALCILLPLPALAETIYVDGECNFAQALASADATDASGQNNIGNCEKGDIRGADTIVLRGNVTNPANIVVSSDITIDGMHNYAFRASNQDISITASSGSLTIRRTDFENAAAGSNWSTLNVKADGNITFSEVDFVNRSPGDATSAGVKLTVTGSDTVRHNVGWFINNRGVQSVDASNGTVDIYRASFHGNTFTGNLIDLGTTNSTLRSSTVGENTGGSNTDYAVSGGKLSNVTVAYNSSGGVTGATRLKNSILYRNNGEDCASGTLTGVNWIGDGAGNCTGDVVTYQGHSPDIDELENGWFKLDDGADAAAVGYGCEIVDQRGHPYGPDPCDLGAYSSYDIGGARAAAARATAAGPAATVRPYSSPTPTQEPPPPTATPPPQGWVLLAEQDDIRRNEVDAAGVGIAHIVEMGFLEAVDIWSEVGWGVTVCHTDYSNGAWVFLDAAGMPREAVSWPAAPHINGWACTFIETPGTVVLLRAEAWSEPPTPTPDPSAPHFGPPAPFALEDCQLITRDMVNLRAEEWGDVLDIIPYETELSASESTEEFYKVVFEEQEGYVHKDWVFIVSGVCEEPVEVEE